MTLFTKSAINAAETIYDILLKGWKSEYCVHSDIGAGGDVTAYIDTLAESIYIEALSPFGSIDSEESGMIGTESTVVIIDPIDGSDNAISGVPYFGSSIALEHDGVVKAGVIVNFANGDIFYKEDGPLMVSKFKSKEFVPVEKRDGSTLGIFERAYAYPKIATSLFDSGIKFRSPGAVALSLAYAHYTDFVLFAGPRRRYDFAAALWMCEDLSIVCEDNLLIVSKDAEKVALLQNIKENR